MTNSKGLSSPPVQIDSRICPFTQASDVPDRSKDLVAQTRELLEPGEIDLVGIIVDTELPSDHDLEMMDATIEIGEVIAEYTVEEPTYVYSGNDDNRFSSNQHQGLTIDGDDFVWECQQLLINGTFTLVFYFETSDRSEEIIEAIEDHGYSVSGVRP